MELWFMTPPKRFPPDDPREWLNRARSDLAIAKGRTVEAYLEDLCYHAQQAAEKAIKAVMILRDIEFPYTHDLDRLLSVLGAFGEKSPERVGQAVRLTRYAGVLRYPVHFVDDEPVSEQTYEEAVAIAEAVVVWAEGVVGYSAGRDAP